MIKKIKAKLSEDIHFKELVKGSFDYFILRISGMVVGYVFTIVVTRNLGASAWGIFALCITILQIVSVLSKLGLDTALLRFIAQYNAQGKGKTIKHIYLKAISLIIPFSIFLSVFLYFLAPILAKELFNKKFLTSYIRIIAFAVLPFTLLCINSESLRAFKKIKQYTIFQNLLPSLVALLLFSIVIFYSKVYNTQTVIYVYIIGIIFSFIVSFLFLQKEFIKTSETQETVSIKYILSVSIPMLISGSLFMVMSWTDTIMLGIFKTEKEVGIYNVTVRLSLITSFTLAAINSIAAPKFAEFWGKKDLEGLRRIAQQSTKIIFWISAPILTAYLLFPSFFMGLFGEEFKKGAWALVILTIGQFVNAASGSVGYILQMTGKQKIFQDIILIAVIVNIILNILLIPKYGINGAAIASAFAVTLINIIPFLLVKFYYGFYTLPIKLKRDYL